MFGTVFVTKGHDPVFGHEDGPENENDFDQDPRHAPGLSRPWPIQSDTKEKTTVTELNELKHEVYNFYKL